MNGIRSESGERMGKMSRTKGKTGEREVARLLREYGFADAERGVQYHGGPNSPDVKGIPGIHIEVKRVEALQLYKAMEQSKNDSAPDEIPTVFHRKNREDWVVIMPLDGFIKLYTGELKSNEKRKEKTGAKEKANRDD